MHMKKIYKKMPVFKTEDEERDFWATADSTEYFNLDNLEEVSFPNLKPTTRSISIRIPEYLLGHLKEKANALMIPYQSLIKIYIQKGLGFDK